MTTLKLPIKKKLNRYFFILILIFILFSSFSVRAHKDRTFLKKYGKVVVFIKTPYFYENMNIALIVGQYAEMLLNEKQYKDSLYLFVYYGSYPEVFDFNRKNHPEDLKIFKVEKRKYGTQIELHAYHLNIKEILCFIDRVVFSLHSIPKKYYHTEIKKLTGNCSGYIDKILARKIYRPNDISELSFNNSPVKATYFIRSNKIYIEYNGDIIDTIPSIFHFYLTFHDRLYYMPDPKCLKTYSYTDKEKTMYKLNHPYFFIKPPRFCPITSYADIIKIYFFTKNITYLVDNKKEKIKIIFEER